MADGRQRYWPGMRRFQSGPIEKWRCAPVRGIRDCFDIEAVDDLLDALRRGAANQDYESEIPRDDVDHRRDHRSEHNDLRSRTVDRDIDQPPVPGYRPFRVKVDYGARR